MIAATYTHTLPHFKNFLARYYIGLNLRKIQTKNKTKQKDLYLFKLIAKQNKKTFNLTL